MNVQYGYNAGRRKRRKRSCLGCFGSLLLWLIMFVVLASATFVVSLILLPPFGDADVAQVLLVGLDDKTPDGNPQRSDTIILYGVKLHGGGALLLSVPRDARVRIPGTRGYRKINAAYAKGKDALLRDTLSDPAQLGTEFPYHVVFDSKTVAALVDAVGGIELTVPHAMNYDDNWAGLHIHLDKGKQRLNGEQVVGFLRWRKNNRGRVYDDDFSRTERQRAFLIAFKDRLKSWHGVMRLPRIYQAFSHHATTNLSFMQFASLAWNSRELQTDTVPGTTRTIGGASYVLCDWDYARERWAQFLAQ